MASLLKGLEANSVVHSYYCDIPNKKVEQISQSEDVLPCHKELLKSPNIDVIVNDDLQNNYYAISHFKHLFSKSKMFWKIYRNYRYHAEYSESK